MIYFVDFTSRALQGLKKLEKIGEKAALKKLNALLDELEAHPTSGTGKPERLKGCQGEIWSRRVTDRHRLVYQIKDTEVIVLVLSTYGHYDDK